MRQLGGEYAVGEKDNGPAGHGLEHRAKDADGTPLSDEAVLAAADFGLFVDLSSMCQKENDQRTEVEDGLFRHALGSLDVVYAHKGLMSLLSTRVPEGVEVDRSYEDRGWSVAPPAFLFPPPLPPLTLPSHTPTQDELRAGGGPAHQAGQLLRRHRPLHR